MVLSLRLAAAALPFLAMDDLQVGLVALQTELDVAGALELVQAVDLEYASQSTSELSRHTVNRIAKRFMLDMRTTAGVPLTWPSSGPGQKYSGNHRVLRLILEHVTQRRVIMEGIPKGSQYLVEPQKILWEIEEERQKTSEHCGTRPRLQSPVTHEPPSEAEGSLGRRPRSGRVISSVRSRSPRGPLEKGTRAHPGLASQLMENSLRPRTSSRDSQRTRRSSQSSNTQRSDKLKDRSSDDHVGKRKAEPSVISSSLEGSPSLGVRRRLRKAAGDLYMTPRQQRPRRNRSPVSQLTPTSQTTTMTAAECSPVDESSQPCRQLLLARSENIVQAVQEFVVLHESTMVAAEVLKEFVPPGTNPERRGAQLGLCYLISQGDQGMQHLQDYFKADGNMHVFYGGTMASSWASILRQCRLRYLGLLPHRIMVFRNSSKYAACSSRLASMRSQWRRSRPS